MTSQPEQQHGDVLTSSTMRIIMGKNTEIHVPKCLQEKNGSTKANNEEKGPTKYVSKRKRGLNRK